MLERAAWIACRDQRPHEFSGYPGIEGVEIGQSPPPLRCAGRVATLGDTPREALEHFDVPLREGSSLVLDPTIELGSAGQAEPIEERAAVHLRGALEGTAE
ncbi:MAG TPA: hypothetical protein VFZ21_14920 [Gemmatimonadaceae bacterium]|nr:hypothetical protein [Gemmatimonadaceae bacterium]